MRDVFYTLLVVWIIWRVLEAFSSRRTWQTTTTNNSSRKEGETTVNYTPPKKRKFSDDEGEYVDYEEIK